MLRMAIHSFDMASAVFRFILGGVKFTDYNGIKCGTATQCDLEA
jgi:hypothetical protein